MILPYEKNIWMNVQTNKFAIILALNTIMLLKQLKQIEKQQHESARIRIVLKGGFEGALTYALVPVLSAYSDDIKARNDFHLLNMDYIWDRVQIANGHDVKEWDIINDTDNVEHLTLECQKKTFWPSSRYALYERFLDR